MKKSVYVTFATVACALSLSTTATAKSHSTHSTAKAKTANIAGVSAKADDSDKTARPHRGGTASWYGGRFHGRLTANGERYNMNELTAAHRTLPFGTLVRVTNLRNNQSVNVRINDRGPFSKGRVIDLSRKANQMINCNLCQVKLEVLNK
ncbi:MULTISPECIES: septal ring lytic transglycosylase RlpA family protein [unclassified Acinetobacter]|uniref:septal ring lytic transglycosylase RlpA family protein n=1 Tax=unclassified Acinetobacter TaxID=196816 RepID=UPI0035B7C80F